MKLSINKSILFVLVVLALMVSALGATTAYADDGAPPPAAEEAAQPPADEPAAEEPAPAEEPAAVEEAAAVAEVLEQLPEDTELVVLDEGGEALPLATEEAAEVLAAPDPYFTVGGTLYQFTAADCDPDTAGDQGCSTPIQAAIDYLAGLDATPDDGTIYVEAGTYNEGISIDGGWWSSLGDLWLMGAGSGSTMVNGYLKVDNVTNAFTVQGFTFTGYVGLESEGDVGMYDVVVDGANTDGGIYIDSQGNVELGNVSSIQSGWNGADVEVDGDITIWDSSFNDNTDTGLGAYSYGGSVTLDGVTASGNGYSGADVEAEGDIYIWDSSFTDNTDTGLEAYSDDGSLTLNRVIASMNGGRGAYVGADGDVQVFDSIFNLNHWEGLYASSSTGSVTLDGVHTFGNAEAGAYLRSTTTVDVFCSNLSSSEWGVIGSTPDLYLNGVTFSGNISGEYMNKEAGGNVWVNDDPCGAGAGGGGSKQLPPALYIVIPQTQAQLPGALGEGFSFGSAFKVELTGLGKNTPDLAFTLSFPIPAGMKDADLAVMFWNGSAWVEVTGGGLVGGSFVITVTEPGLYALVSK
jgi:hypothetical protein